jgi:hypothetical protein
MRQLPDPELQRALAQRPGLPLRIRCQAGPTLLQALHQRGRIPLRILLGADASLACYR